MKISIQLDIGKRVVKNQLYQQGHVDLSGVATGGSRWGRVLLPPPPPPQRKICQNRKKEGENREKREKSGKRGKIRKKEENSGRKGKNREGSFILPLLTDRVGYATGRPCRYEWSHWNESEDTKSLRNSKSYYFLPFYYNYNFVICIP